MRIEGHGAKERAKKREKERTRRNRHAAKQRERRGVARRGERAGCRKLEGRRSRPGLVLGLADSLALSQRNASNAGEPLLPPSFLRSWLLSVVSFSRSSWEPSVSLSLSLSISLYPPLFPLSGLPFIQFTLSFIAMEGEKATYVCCIAYHAALSVSLPISGYCMIVSFSLSVPYVVSSQSNFAFFQRPPYSIKKAKRDEAEFRAKEREDECKATNKFSGITLSARARARIECAWKQLAYRARAPEA